MEINTEKFGAVEVNEDTIFNFVKPVIGFEEQKKFILIEHDENSPFKWLQSIEDPELAFPVTMASYFDINYIFEVNDEDADALGLESADDLLVLSIANIPANHPENATINLLSPIIMNFSNKKAMQTILLDTNYSTRHALFPSCERNIK